MGLPADQGPQRRPTACIEEKGSVRVPFDGALRQGADRDGGVKVRDTIDSLMQYLTDDLTDEIISVRELREKGFSRETMMDAYRIGLIIFDTLVPPGEHAVTIPATYQEDPPMDDNLTTMVEYLQSRQSNTISFGMLSWLGFSFDTLVQAYNCGIVGAHSTTSGLMLWLKPEEDWTVKPEERVGV